MTLITDSISGITKVLTAEEIKDAEGAVIGSNVTVNEHFWGMLTSNVVSMIVASKVTRDRVSKGNDPVVGLLF
jgi:fructose-specific phosphotransferase system component IIB